MKPLIEIFPKPRTGSFIWEHILKTVMGLGGGFGIIFFTLFLSGGKSNNDTAVHLIVYLFVYHIEITIGLCICFAVVMNVIAFYRNQKNIYVRKIEVSEDSNRIRLSLISVYSDIEVQHELPFNNLRIFESKIKELFIGTHKVISFSDLDHKAFGMIDPQHEIHRKEMPEFRTALQKIKAWQLNIDNF